jgi:hypothetical protein
MADSETPSDPGAIVLQAELMASSPERVRAWLEQRASDARSLRWHDNKTLERALLERNEPLINLSLARFGSDSDVLKALWAGPARDNKPLRLATLMNEVAGDILFGGIPGSLLVRQDLKPFMAGLDLEETTALFSNRTLSNGFLTGFFEQKAAWEGLDDERRMAAVAALTKNPRMQARHEGPMDGYAEFMHDEVFQKGWELAGEVPVTTQWATYLCWFYEKLPPKSYSMPLELAARWVPDPADTEQIEQEQKNVERGDLGPYARIRKGIARLAVRAAQHDKEAREALATHTDPAVRAAVYFDSEMTPEEMRAAGERDLMLSFNELMWNSLVWRTKEQRSLLHDMAWDSRRDPNNYLDPQNTYNARLEYHREKSPEWFKDEEEVEQPDLDKPLTNGTFSSQLEGVKGEVLTGTDLARATYQAQLKLLKRTAWMGWGIAVALAVILIHSL